MVARTPPPIDIEPPAGLSGNSDEWVGVLGTSKTGTGVCGKSDSGPGVAGSSKQGEGVTGSGWVNGVHGISISQANTDNGVLGESRGSGKGVSGISNGGIGVYGKGGSLAAQFDGTVTVNGDVNANANINVTGDIVLTGSDCAEDFDASTQLEPGTVVVIDDGGSLAPCGSSYDRRVAGVVSGAGSFRPGLLLGGGRGDTSNPRVPLALSGKVYCKVDAGFSRIEVGSLLTTSPTPGHAMSATDKGLAFGSVIGKALAGMNSGRGLIPILVSLQ